MKEIQVRSSDGAQSSSRDFDASRMKKSAVPPPFGLSAGPIQRRSVGADLPLPNGQSYSSNTWTGDVYASPTGKDGEPTVELDDANQGGLNDCYFVAAMGAVANNNPKAIQDMIKDNGDGTYDVTLHLHQGFFSFLTGSEETVTVTGNFPNKGTIENPELAYSKYGNEKELWPMLIEKAYAQYKGGYDKIEFGNSGNAMQILTGESTTTFLTATTSDMDLISIIKVATTNGKPITASSILFEEGDERKAKSKSLQVYEHHAYVVLSVDENNKTIELHNPWGHHHPPAINIADFRICFNSVAINAK